MFNVFKKIKFECHINNNLNETRLPYECLRNIQLIYIYICKH